MIPEVVTRVCRIPTFIDRDVYPVFQESGLRHVLKIMLKSLIRALHISDRFAFMISFVMPSLPGALRFLSVLQACIILGLVTGRSKNVDVVPSKAFMSFFFSHGLRLLLH